METIKINSIDEVDKYIDQLKNIKVWVCHEACGKSYLARMDERFFDMDKYKRKLRLSGVVDFKEQAIKEMQVKLNTGNYILLNYKPWYFLEHLRNAKLPFVYLRMLHCKECLCRMKNRGSPKKRLLKVKSDFISNNYLIPEQESKFYIVMNDEEFLSDYAWKVFGYPQKYIQCYFAPPLKAVSNRFY